MREFASVDGLVIVGKWEFMGEQMRSAEEEARYNRRWLIGLVVGPLLLGALAAAWMFSVAGRLPAELASHWNSKNEVDGYMSLTGTALMAFAMGGIGAVVAPMPLLLRTPSTLFARIGVGFGLAFGTAMTALSVGVVAGQLDLVDAAHAKISGPVMAVGIAAAFVVGCAAVWLYRPGEVDRTQSSEAAATNEAARQDHTALGHRASERAARGETMRIEVSMGHWKWLLSLGVGLTVAVSTYLIFPGLALLGVLIGGIIWVFCQGTAVIGPDGVKVLASGFWKLMPLEWKELKSVEVLDIKAMDYGGWGYRMGAGSVGFIMGNGPAVVMKGGYHQTWIISMPSLEAAGEAAALINAYIHAATVRS